MFISEYYPQKQPVISFEIFPPKKDYPVETIFDTLDQLKKLNPDYISVTYGAGGSSRERTKEIASRVKNNYAIESLAHLTCVGHSLDEIDTVLAALQAENIHNVLALRGDPPQGDSSFSYDQCQLKHAVDLVKYIKAKGSFCIGAAAYPEGHPQCDRLSRDWDYLKQKADSGVDFLITQLFFDNRVFYNFMENIRRIGIATPVSVGIMPVLNGKQIKRFISLCGASMPAKLLLIVEKYGDNAADMEKAGIEYASRQVADLLANQVEGIHLYTMNKSRQVRQILTNVGLAK